jgi:hypothetical protein
MLNKRTKINPQLSGDHAPKESQNRHKWKATFHFEAHAFGVVCIQTIESRESKDGSQILL